MKPKNSENYEIAIHIQEVNWSKYLPDIDALSRRAIFAAIDQISPRPFAEISLAFLDDAHVCTLNREYRGKDMSTNVLSFSAVYVSGFSPLLGDIVLAYETVSSEAKSRKLALRDHVSHLLVHGFYHLQGYDHINPEDARQMEALEIKALADLGIANPYDIEDKS